jgi:hypothetical protein
MTLYLSVLAYENKKIGTLDVLVVDWFAVRVTPMHLGLKLQALFALLFCQLQRRSTPRRRERPLLLREEIGREMADKFRL